MKRLNGYLAAFPFDALYSLDQETSLPLKAEFYPAGSNQRPGSAVRVWEAKTFDSTEGGHQFPLISENTYFTGGEANSYNIVTVTEIHYGREYAASMFWPTIQPGVVVNDSIKKTFTKTPDLAAAQKPSAVTKPTFTTPTKPPSVEAATVASPAVTPWSWSSVGSSAALGLGILLIGAGVLAGWRQGR